MRKKIRVLLHSCQLQGSQWAVAGGHRVRKEDCGGEVGRNEEMGSSARRRDEGGAGEWQVTPRIPHEVIGWTVTEWNRVTEGEVGWEKLTWGFGLQASERCETGAGMRSSRESTQARRKRAQDAAWAPSQPPGSWAERTRRGAGLPRKWRKQGSAVLNTAEGGGHQDDTRDNKTNTISSNTSKIKNVQVVSLITGA